MALWSRRWPGRGDGSGCWRRAGFASVRELAEAERVSLSYTSRILRLTLLAPDIIERILDRCPGPQLAELMQPLPVAWERQQEWFQQ